MAVTDIYMAALEDHNEAVFLTDSNDIEISTPVIGDFYWLTWSYIFDGTQGENFDIAVSINGNLFHLENTSAGRDFFGMYHYIGLSFQPGTYTVKVELDPYNKIAESDESNNTCERTFSIAGNSDYLIKTTWNQYGYFIGNSTLELNAYCPVDPVSRKRSVTGCSNTATAQILYYFAQQGHEFTIQLDNDMVNDSNTAITIDASAANAEKYGYLEFSKVNEKLADFDLNSAEDIAALIFASGVIADSSYSSEQTSTTCSNSEHVFENAGFKSVDHANHSASDLWNDDKKTLSDAGWQMIRDNIAAKKPVLVSLTTPAHSVIIDGYDQTGDMVHINFGWGIYGNKAFDETYQLEVGSGWYSRSECDAMQIDSMLYNFTPDTEAPSITVTPDTTAAGVSSVTLTAAASDDVGVYGIYYQLEADGSWFKYETPVTVTGKGEISFKAVDRAKNETITTYNVTNIRLDKPVVSLSTEQLTNKDVTVSAVFDKTATLNQYSINGGEWQNYKNAFTVSENCTVTFRSTDGSTTVEIEKNITNIDKTAPTLTITGNPENYTNRDITLYAAASDGIIEYLDGNEWVKKANLTVSENGTYKFRATDEAGNITEKSVIVSKIDKTAPEITISGNPENLTNQDVTLKASCDDNKAVIEYFDGTKWKSGNQFTVTENGTYKFRATDEAGNVTIRDVIVDKIDKVAPALEISGNPTVWTNKNVELTANVSEGVVEFFNGTKWIAGSKLVVTENGEYQFRATDEAGNVTIRDVIVDKIDKTAPIVTVSADTQWTQNPVIITATANEGTVEYFDGVEWVEQNSVSAVSNGTYKFRATDEAGNVSQIVQYNVSNIDSKNPVAHAAVIHNKDKYLFRFYGFDSDSGIAGYKIRYSNDGKNFNELSNTYSSDSVEISGIGKVQVFEIQAIDQAGNSSEWTHAVIETIDKPASDSPEELIFISSKFNEKTTGKKQNGVTLTLGENAFASIANIIVAGDHKLVILDKELDGDAYTGLTNVLGNSALPTIKVTDNSYSSKVTATSKNTLNINNDTDDAEFHNFATVNLSGIADVKLISGGKESGSEDIKSILDKKGAITDTEKLTYSRSSSGKVTATAGSSVSELRNFATISATGATVTNAFAGNKSTTISVKVVDSAAKLQKNISESTTIAANGKITLTDSASAGHIENFTNVELKNSSAETIANFAVKTSRSENSTYDFVKNTVTRKITITDNASGAGTLKAADSTISGDINGFATVNLVSTSAQNITQLTAGGGVCANIKETLDVKTGKDDIVTAKYSKTETFNRNGKLTATAGSSVGNIVNFNTVTLDNSTAGNISNIKESKRVTTGTETWDVDDYGTPAEFDLHWGSVERITVSTPKLSGTVTMKNGAAAGNISNFKTLDMTDSSVTGVENVEKTIIKKGSNRINSYSGTTGDDTLTVNKGAVLTIGAIDFKAGAKDKLVNNGTMILTSTDLAVNNVAISGKGEIAASDDICEALGAETTAALNIVNIGENITNFRGTAYEKADDLLNKAVKWDAKTDYDGWLGSWERGEVGDSDDIDCIKFTVAKNSVIDLDFTGDIIWELLDKKGNALTDFNIDSLAAGDYILKIEQQDKENKNSISYSVKLG